MPIKPEQIAFIDDIFEFMRDESTSHLTLEEQAGILRDNIREDSEFEFTPECEIYIKSKYKILTLEEEFMLRQYGFEHYDIPTSE